MTNQQREENDRVLCSALQRYAQEESSNLPSAEELSGVTFTKAYEKRKRQILRAKGRPAGVKVLHGKSAAGKCSALALLQRCSQWWP